MPTTRLSTWIDPTDDFVRTDASGRITDILDKGPTGNDVSESGTSGPPSTVEVNGLTVLEPVDLNDGLETPVDYTHVGNEYTVAIAYTDNGSTAGTSQQHLASAGDNNGPPGWTVGKDFPDNFIGFRTDNGAEAVLGVASSAENIDVVIARYDPVNDFCEIGRNGKWANAGADAGSDDATTNPTKTYQFAVCNYEGMNGGWDDGIVGDVVLCNNVLRYDEMQRLEGYFAVKYNALGVLPVGHPFKTSPPDNCKSIDAEFLANFAGADGATSYTAETGQTASFQGNAALTDTRSKFGQTGLLLDGTGDSVSFPDSADYEFGSGDFTIEGWFSPDSATPSGDIASKYDATADAREWIAGFSATAGEFRFIWNNSTGVSGGNVQLDSTDAPTMVAGEFYHVAYVRRGPNIFIFVDGVKLTLTGTQIGTDTINSEDSGLRIGDRESGGGSFDGVIDSVRITKGQALYTANFGAPRRGFSLPVEPELIANFNGPNTTSYTSEDAGARVATFQGNAIVTTLRKKFGHRALRCDGAGDRLEFPDSVDFEMGSGDFFAELWAVWDSAPGTSQEVMLGKWQDTGNNREWVIYYNNNKITFGWDTLGTGAGGFSSADTGAFTPTVGTWYHFAVERKDDILTLWIDGVVELHTAITDTFFSGAAPLVIGGGDNGTQDFTGDIDGVRVFKGRGSPYHADITAVQDHPYSPLDIDADVLLNFDGADLATSYTSDDSTGFDLTFFGGAQLSDTERFRGVTSLDVIAEADAVEIPSGNGLEIGTGDFTLEFMMRWTSAPSSSSFEAIIDQRVDGVSQVRPYIGSDNVSGAIVWYVSATSRITGTTVPAINTWYHVVVERVDGVTRLYIDGQQEGSPYTDANDYLDGPLTIGSRWDQGASSNSFEGYIDMFRLSIGRAIYRGNFDVPVAGVGNPIL